MSNPLKEISPKFPSSPAKRRPRSGWSPNQQAVPDSVRDLNFGWLAIMSMLVLPFFGCAGESGNKEQPAAYKVSLTVAVPPGSPTVYLTGNLPLLGPWDPAGLAMEGTGSKRTATISVPSNTQFEYKFTLGSWDNEAQAADGARLENHRVSVNSDLTLSHEIARFKDDSAEFLMNAAASGVLGTLEYRMDVPSEFLAESRHIAVWLPPGYEVETDRRYRVLYMQDGQSLFDPRVSGGETDWGVDEAIVAGVSEGRFDPVIVVAPWNSSRRMLEYSPWHEGPEYARFLKEELLPWVDSNYRTLSGPENTFVMGSSMGGLLSFYLVKEHSDSFGACGCVSSHFPLSPAMVSNWTGSGPTGAQTPYILADIGAGEELPGGGRFFFDYGTETLDGTYEPTHQAVREWFLSEGYTQGTDFKVQKYQGAAHDEASWRDRVGDQLDWMLSTQELQ